LPVQYRISWLMATGVFWAEDTVAEAEPAELKSIWEHPKFSFINLAQVSSFDRPPSPVCAAAR